MSAAIARRYRDPVLLGFVVLGSWSAVNFQWNAAYPPGDGGLFYAMIRDILAGHFRYPDTIAYNGFAIPFAYSPGALYGCALLAALTGMTIPHAMNLWMGAWIFALGPAGFWCARRFGLDSTAAIVCAATLVVMPQGVEWIGFGGGITRAPGFVLYVLAAGECWHALGTRRRRDLVVAGACAGSIALVHMEFAFLAAVTFVVLCAYRRPTVAAVLTIGAAAAVVTIPWLVLLLRHPAAARLAVQTASLDPVIGNLVSLMTFLGLNPAGIAFASDAGLFALIVLFFTAARRETLWSVWFVALFAVDQRAAFQCAHLPIALAFGSLTGAMLALPWRRMAASGVVLTLLALLCAASARSAMAFRMTNGIAGDLHRIAGTLPDRARVLVLPAIASGAVDAFAADQTLEWFPVFSARQQSVLTYDGMEWVDKGMFSRMWRAHVKIMERCVKRGGGAPCVLAVVRTADLTRAPLYVYLPRRTSGAILTDALRENDHFERVLHTATADVFLVHDALIARR